MKIKRAMVLFLLFIISFIITSYIVLHPEYYEFKKNIKKAVNSKVKKTNKTYENIEKITNKQNSEEIEKPPPITEIENQEETDPDPKLVAIVLTKSSDTISRKNIRETWSHLNAKNNFEGFSYKVYFAVAFESEMILNKVNEENYIYKDVIMLNEIDENYENLNKKVILALKYVYCKHKNSLFVVKTDSDVLVNIKALVRHLIEIQNKSIDYEGYIVDNSHIIRNMDDRYYEPRDVNSGSDVYKPYAIGSGYIVRTTLLPCMTNAVSNLLPHKNEDTYVGALVHFCSGRYFYDPKLFNRKCNLNYTPEDFDTDFDHFKKCLFTHRIKSYEYKEKYEKLTDSG